MAMSQREYSNIINYLLDNTTYRLENLTSYTDGQLYNMKKRIEAAMHSYPKEIFDYYKANPLTQPRYTYDELTHMKYNQLSEIRKSLNIKKTGKKVTSSIEAPDVAEKGRQQIDKMPTSQVAATIITNQEREIDDYQFITYKEAVEIYGPDISEEYLEKRGFKLYDSLAYNSQFQKEDSKYFMIDTLLSLDLSIKGESLTAEDLLDLDLEKLEFLYSLAVSLNEKLEDERRFSK